MHNKFTLQSVALTDWLAYFSGCATLGAVVYILVDRSTSEKETNHLKRISEIPFIVLASPCDPSMSFCNINILDGVPSEYGRGFSYFSICNKGKINAYDIAIDFYRNSEMNGQPFFCHYIDHLSPLLVFGGTETEIQEFGGVSGVINSYPVSSLQKFYEFKEAIYSQYRVDPVTKAISTEEFDICGCLNRDCTIVPNTQIEKELFVRITYHSTYAKGWRYQIITEYKVHTTCLYIATEEIPGNMEKQVILKGIVLVDYRYSFVNM
jgi:hypothetical protein